MKSKIITIQLQDGRQMDATVLFRNGTTRTVRSAEGFIYEVTDYDCDHNGVYRVN